MGYNNSTMDLYKKVATCLYRLFITNIHAIGIQMDDGRYVTKYIPVSEELLEEMLIQKASIGCYQQQYKSDKLRWICFDFDCNDKEHPDLPNLYKEYVLPFLQICNKYNIKYLTEFSGRRGIHVWIIFSYLIAKNNAFSIISFLKKELLNHIGVFENVNLDIFPATSSAIGNILGKQVKVPLSTHKSGSRSIIFKENLKTEITEDEEAFLKEQLSILGNYETNDYEKVIESIGINQDDLCLSLKYKKYRFKYNLELSIARTIELLSETKVYSEIFSRLMQGQAYNQDWLVLLGTFSPLNDGGIFVKDLFSHFPNYDPIKTSENIKKYIDMYYPATFGYLYKIYSIEIEKSLDESDTGFSFLLKKNGINPIGIEYEHKGAVVSKHAISIEDTLKKEIKYFLKNDEVINIDIWNDLHSQKYLDLYNLQKTVNEICENGEVREKWEPNAYIYTRNENDTKVRKLVSLAAYDRILTTHLSLLLQNKSDTKMNSFGYKLSFFSKEDIFLNWYTSWKEYINKIRTFLDIPFMGNYSIFTIDLKNFYDNIDFTSIYNKYKQGCSKKEKNIFRFLINYNDILMRKLFDDRRIGVPQGPAYARVFAEIFLDAILSEILLKYDSTQFYLYRYVDDIIVFGKPNWNSYEMFNGITNKLLSYGLPINNEKTYYYGKINELSKEERGEILREGKFTYDLQISEKQGFITCQEREKDIYRYFRSHEFKIDDARLFFNKRVYSEAGDSYFYKYVHNVMGSLKGRGSAFQLFYDSLFSDYEKVKYVLKEKLFFQIPLNSINFGNMLGELYLAIQNKQLPINLLVKIQNTYLDYINISDLNNEYLTVVNSLKMIKIEEDNLYD